MRVSAFLSTGYPRRTGGCLITLFRAVQLGSPDTFGQDVHGRVVVSLVLLTTGRAHPAALSKREGAVHRATGAAGLAARPEPGWG